MEGLSPYAKSLLALLAVLAAIWLIYALIKYVGRITGAMPGLAAAGAHDGEKPRVVARHALIPSQNVTLLEYKDKRYVIYSAGGQLLLLDTLRADE